MWSDTPCKISTRAKDKKGYTKLKIKGKTVREARHVLEQKLGRPIKRGYEASHACNLPSCIEPEHLFEETHTRNVRYSHASGRAVGNTGKQKTHCINNHLLSPDNLYVLYGRRYCRQCRKVADEKRR